MPEIDYLSIFSGYSIIFPPRGPSTYSPCSRMMYHIVHLMNEILCDSPQFRRACPNYHPYIFRLYCGIIFCIQCLRAQLYAGFCTDSDHEFLNRFLDCYPPDSLPIPGPLIHTVQTLCASKPQFEEFGYVVPLLPDPPGPKKRGDFILDGLAAYGVPNIPGIVALIEHLGNCFDKSVYPRRGQHIPVRLTACEFGKHQFPDHEYRSDLEKASLVSPGLEYACEADVHLHRNFSERLRFFDIPRIRADDETDTVAGYLSMNRKTEWFSQVQSVASDISGFFKSSGSMKDCPAFGNMANQYIIEYSAPAIAPPLPRQIADSNSRFPFAVRVTTSLKEDQAPFLTLPMATIAQTNVVAPPKLPVYGQFGTVNGTRLGYFWQLDVNSSAEDISLYWQLNRIIQNDFVSRA